jgi:hypothetical protein
MSQFVVKTLRRIGLACPSMWEGELSDGRHVYVRYRWGAISIEVGLCRADALLYFNVDSGVSVPKPQGIRHSQIGAPRNIEIVAKATTPPATKPNQ